MHIISIIAWMAGLLYLPRIFVYHCQTSFGSETHEKFVQMEYRLLKFIMNPAMIVSWILGVGMLGMLGMFYYLLRSASLGAARRALHCSYRSPSRAGASARRGVTAPTRMHGSAKLMRELQNLLPRADHTEAYA